MFNVFRRRKTAVPVLTAPAVLVASADEVAAINTAFPDRSAGRWCESCRQFGSHHTDRHPDFAAHAHTVFSS